MTNVVHIHVPAFENLSMKEIFAFFQENQGILQFVPEGKELRKVPKAWVIFPEETKVIVGPNIAEL